ncbi:MAG: hypothetical protein EOM20_16510 [Spartobacteria bacterium]|nr:hypothetical protein [Spartobacteria bacterium]
MTSKNASNSTPAKNPTAPPDHNKKLHLKPHQKVSFEIKDDLLILRPMGEPARSLYRLQPAAHGELHAAPRAQQRKNDKNLSKTIKNGHFYGFQRENGPFLAHLSFFIAKMAIFVHFQRGTYAARRARQAKACTTSLFPRWDYA